MNGDLKRMVLGKKKNQKIRQGEDPRTFEENSQERDPVP